MSPGSGVFEGGERKEGKTKIQDKMEEKSQVRGLRDGGEQMAYRATYESADSGKERRNIKQSVVEIMSRCS